MKPRLADVGRNEEELRDQGLLGGGVLVPPTVLSCQCGSDARRSPPTVEANAQRPQQSRPPSEWLHWERNASVSILEPHKLINISESNFSFNSVQCVTVR